ncbi:hypothetical protein N9Z41_00555 [bacterium]|nr:hypothetical protein [bacterium]
MKEQLITFETAKLAKEKGFDMLNCTNAYNVFRENLKKSGEGLITTEAEEEPHHGGVTCILRTFYQSKDWTLAPTQSLLQKWLREEHGIHIVIKHTKSHMIGNFIDNNRKQIFDEWTFSFKGMEYSKHNSYEKALEKGLQEALKLI